MSESDIKKIAQEKNLSFIGVTFIDLTGVPRVKPTSIDALDSVLKKGSKTAKATLAIAPIGGLTPGSSTDQSQGDLLVVPDLKSFVVPSYAPKTGMLIGDLYELDGTRSPYCSRGAYLKVLSKAADLGYEFHAGLEFEFYIVTRENGGLKPLDNSQIFSQAGYYLYHDLFEEFRTALNSVNVRVHKAHVEGGGGQLEVDLAAEMGVKVADDFIFFRDTVRQVARRHGWIASFMPKIGSHWWGNGLHAHLNLSDSNGNNAFSDETDRLGLSSLGYHFTGGILNHVKALCAITAPTVNSYKRLLPGRWNTDAVFYAAGHRGAAIRIPDERGPGARIECRFLDCMCNPYLAMACILAAGLEGIQRKSDPGQTVNYDTTMTDRELKKRGLELLPRSLGEALNEFEKDSLLRQTLGEPMFEEYLKQKSFEVAQAADQVTQWEIDHFLDSG